MQSFQWTGMNKEGKRLKGLMQATDAKAAEIDLKKMDIDLISIHEKKQTSIKLFQKKAKPKDVVLFTRYLSIMLKAGMPILQSLDIIGRDQDNIAMTPVVNSIKSQIAAGTSFADALSQHPKVFSKLYINLVRAGEKSGTLEKVLERLTHYMERIENIKRKVKNALVYPATIIVVALIVSLILLLFVIPQFQVLFDNAKVPLPYFTAMIISFSKFLQYNWLYLIIALVALGWLARYLLKTNQKIALFFDIFILKLYIIGPIIKKSIIARFTSTLAITLDAGLPIVDAMKSMAEIMGNNHYSKGITQISEDLMTGNTLSFSMSKTNLFPSMVIQMIAVGEAAGTLPVMLNHIADYYQDEVDSIVKNLSSLIEPIIIVVLGIIIGTFVVAMYLPIFKLGTAVG